MKKLHKRSTNYVLKSSIWRVITRMVTALACFVAWPVLSLCRVSLTPRLPVRNRFDSCSATNRFCLRKIRNSSVRSLAISRLRSCPTVSRNVLAAMSIGYLSYAMMRILDGMSGKSAECLMPRSSPTSPSPIAWIRISSTWRLQSSKPMQRRCWC